MNNERVATLLASGLLPAQVASIVGCSPGRISQIMKEEGFDTLLKGKQVLIEAKGGEEVALNVKYESAEQILLTKIIEASEGAELPALTNALRVVSERQTKEKARVNPILNGNPVINTYVQLMLPGQVLKGTFEKEVHLSKEREIIAIGDRNLAPMSSSAVTELFASMDVPLLEEQKGKQDEPIRIAEKAEGSSPEIVQSTSETPEILVEKQKILQNGATKFLSSLFPSPAHTSHG